MSCPNLQKIYFIRSYLSFVAIIYVINFSYRCVLVLFKSKLSLTLPVDNAYFIFANEWPVDCNKTGSSHLSVIIQQATYVNI